jgi:branched-chain amino acid transport system ATP-binding protein
VTPLLDVREITVRFGGNLALDRASLVAEKGLITGLIGPNGAGKSTLFNVVTGLQRPSSGRVLLAGTEITKLSPTRRARQGMARSFQRLELFPMLTVRENVAVAAETHRRWSKERRDVDAEVEAMLGRVGLAKVADARTTAIPTGLGRRVELARALVCRPKVLLLDEPASGQDEAETEEFASLLRELAQGGMAVVLVEHDMKLVMEVCDVINVLDFGSILAVGTPEEIRIDEKVLGAYLGTKASA